MKSPRITTADINAKRWLALIPVVIAATVVVALIRTRSRPIIKATSELGTALRVIEVPVVDLVPRVYGQGLAEPARVWQAVAQVKGSAVFVSPQLDAGMLVDKGTVLIRIDPADYELAVARLQAAIAETRAHLDELKVEQAQHEASLKIERASLALAETSLRRKRLARTSGATSEDEVDREARAVLVQKQVIQKLENALGLLPVKQQTLEATLAVHNTDLQQAKLHLARTVIKAPFDCRLADVSVERDQFVNVGQTLFEAHGAAAVEIEAKFRPEQLRALLSADKRRSVAAGLTMETLRDIFDLKVTIRVRSGEWESVWPARFDRIREGVDPRTRAINVIAVVDNPYQQVIPGIRPALMRGMYCEMELAAPVRSECVIVPRSALTADHVYLINSDNRLRGETVRIAFTQGEFAVVESGLSGGEKLVVTKPAVAIEGMKINAISDPDLQNKLARQAEGQGGSR